MAIKMRVNQDRGSKCFNCGCEWKNTPEMYDLKIGYTKERTLPLCKNCIDVLFQKTLRASNIYNAKLKTKEDQARIIRSKRLLEPEENSMSVSEALRGYKISKED